MDESGEGPEVAADLKWSYADSPYVDFGSEYTEKLRAPFVARPNLQELGVDEWKKEIELRMDAVEQAARQLDGEGAFGAGQRRSRLLVAVEIMPPVPSNVERVARLNDTDSEVFKQCWKRLQSNSVDTDRTRRFERVIWGATSERQSQAQTPRDSQRMTGNV